jgi:AraC-like DNA-binding protein
LLSPGGFNDAAHFSRSFSRAYGVAPSEFRIGHARDPLTGKAE